MHNILPVVVVALLFCSVQCADVLITTFGADFTGQTLSDNAFFNAIGSAVPGDTVLVTNGLFIISKPIKLKSGITLKGDQLAMIKQTAKQPLFSQDLVSDIRITDITLDGNNISTHGIVISNSLRISIERVNIRNVASWPDVFGPIGIYFSTNVSNSLIDNCTMFSISPNTSYGGGVRITGGSNNTIQNNHISVTGRGGIFLSDFSQHNIVKNNVITKSGLGGAGCMSIESWNNCDYTIIEDNSVDHWISLDACHHCAVRRNNVSASDQCYAGLAAVGSISTVFTDNQVIGGQGMGFVVSNDPLKDYLLFARNTIRGMTSFGVELVGGTNGTYHHYFYNNTFENTEALNGPDSGHGFRFNGQVFNVVLENNIIRNNSGYGIQAYQPVGSLEFIGNSITNNNGTGFSGSPGSPLVWINNTVTGNAANPAFLSSVTNQRPIAVINAPSTVYVGDIISISSASRDPDGSIVKLLWDLDQGYVREEQTIVFSYDKPGKKRVTLVAWDDGGRGARAEAIITVLDPAAQPPPIVITTPMSIAVTTDVVPIIECYSIGSGGAVTVYFGYNNPTPQSVTVPRGPQNNINPSNFNGDLMTVFTPGRTQYYPAAAFNVQFSSATSQVTWTLGSYQVTADLSNTALQCPSQASFELILTAPSINSTQLDDILTQIANSLNVSRDDLTSSLRELNCTASECTYSLVVMVNSGLEQQVISQLKDLLESLKANSDALSDTPDVTVKEVITRPTGREVTGVKFDPPVNAPVSLSTAHFVGPTAALSLTLLFVL